MGAPPIPPPPPSPWKANGTQAELKTPQAIDYAGFAAIAQVCDSGATVTQSTFSSTDVNTTTEKITVTAHPWGTAQKVRLTTTGTLPTGLAAATDYYVIVSDANTIQLATTVANAKAGTAINLTGAGSGNSIVVPPAGTWFLHTPIGRNVLMMYDGSSWIPIISLGAMTVYVDDGSGSDSTNGGTGTGSSAFKTIQYAVNRIPNLYGGNVTITVTAETYRETVTVADKISLGDYSISIVGALTAVESSVAVTSATAKTLTKTGAGWTTDEHIKRICKCTKSGQTDVYLYIRSNTATVLTLAGIFGVTIDSSWNFEILDKGTIISGANSGTPTTPARMCITVLNSKVIIYDTAVEYGTSPAIDVGRFGRLTLYRSKHLGTANNRYLHVFDAWFVTQTCYIEANSAFGIYGQPISLQVWKTWIEGDDKTDIGVYGIIIKNGATTQYYQNLINKCYYGIFLTTAAQASPNSSVNYNTDIENCGTGAFAQLNAVGENLLAHNYTGCSLYTATSTGGQIT